MDDLGDVMVRLRALNEPVPRPRRLPSESDVRSAEEQAGVRLHDDLRRYLLTASDVVHGTVEPVTLGDGHTNFETVLDDARRSGVPPGLIPFCEDNGDYVCMAADGAVVYWSHNGTTDERWPDLATWISQVWIDEA